MIKPDLTDSKEFAKVARYAFAPVYPYLAKQIKAKFGINNGICVDVGSGPGNLAIEMAKITDLKVFSLDIQHEMCKLAQENIMEAGLSHRVITTTADVCRMPFPNNFADLVISRGSIFFWKDKIAGCTEIYRILKPGGVAYCGGGMGSKKIRAEVMRSIKEGNMLTPEKAALAYNIGKPGRRLEPDKLCTALVRAGIPANAKKENGGIWIQFIK